MTVIVYGTTSGNAEYAANIIAKKIDDETKIIEVSNLKSDTLKDCNRILLGTSSGGFGEIQDDWDAKLDILKKYNFTDKKVGFFGLGDQESYPDSFVGGMGELYESVKGSGAEFFGSWPVDGYDFADSSAVVNGKFVGLALDEDNQGNLTEKRIEDWIKAF